jgi:thioredoxin 1
MSVKNIITKHEFKEAINQGYTLVDFHALWCGPCKMLSSVIEKVAKVATDLNFVKIDIDQLPDLAHEFQVNSVPSVFLFKDGKPIGSFVGYKPESEILTFIQQKKR